MVDKELKKIRESLRERGFSVEEIGEMFSIIRGSKKEKFGLSWECFDDVLSDNRSYSLQWLEDKSIYSAPEVSLKHRLIEGDNLDTLNYLKNNDEVFDVIYIDPPYNTGTNRFIYQDNYSANGNKLKYKHSDWLEFMYQRLIVARDVLAEHGIIFLSIDDFELAQLKLLCDEVFGEKNFISNIVWKKSTVKNGVKHVSNISEYVLVYAKNKAKSFKFNKIPLADSSKGYPYRDEFYDSRGGYMPETLCKSSLRYSPTLDYIIEHEGVQYIPGNSTVDEMEYRRANARKTNGIPMWRWSKTKVEWGIKNGFIVFNPEKKMVYAKTYEKVDNSLNPIVRGTPATSFLQKDNLTNNSSSMMIIDMFGSKVFDYPKPVELLKYLLRLVPIENAKVLDFFAGSGTTGHAVLELNRDENKKFEFTLATNNQNNISRDITAERISKVINGYHGYRFDKDYAPCNANFEYLIIAKDDNTVNE